MKFPERYEAKGIKQQMIENRMKFDRDVLAHGYEDYDEYDEWDPFLDLEGSASIFTEKIIIKSHADGMAVARPYGFEIHFVTSSISESDA